MKFITNDSEGNCVISPFKIDDEIIFRIGYGLPIMEIRMNEMEANTFLSLFIKELELFDNSDKNQLNLWE